MKTRSLRVIAKLGWIPASIVALGIAIPALCFDYPLSSTAIRNAYFLGKANDQKTAEFFAQYTQHPPIPKTGPHVSMIQLETPYATVVERAQQLRDDYDAPTVEQDFLDKPGMFRLYVQIDLTPSYSNLVQSADGAVRARSVDFWRSFKVTLVQNTVNLAPSSIHGQPLYSSSPMGSIANGDLTGAQIELDYLAEQIESDEAEIRVLTPDGQRVRAKFDLAKLK